MALSSPGSGPLIAGFIVGGVGLALGIAGTVVIMVAPGAAAAEHARLAALPAPDAISISDTPVGREVIVEGTIAADQPVLFRDFVAYVKEEEQRDARERERSGKWKTVDKVTPPLNLVVAEGTLRVVNTNYRVNLAATHSYDRGMIETVYTGLVAREAVFAHGRVAAGGGLEAMTVGSGTRASYLATVEGNVAAMWWLGAIFLIVASILAIVAVILFITAARIRATSAR